MAMVDFNGGEVTGAENEYPDLEAAETKIAEELGIQAAPGMVILEDLGVPNDVSDAGLILPGNSDTKVNYQDLHIGRVIAAGRWVSKRSGVPTFDAPDIGKDWLEPGDFVQWIPHNPYRLVSVGGRKIVGVFSDDIMVVPKKKPQAFPTPVWNQPSIPEKVGQWGGPGGTPVVTAGAGVDACG